MGQYRKRLEIIADILSVVKGGARKTRIMYQANLSYRLLTIYLRFVRESGLVSTQGKGTYILTKKGHEFLEKYSEYSERFERLEVELKNVQRVRGNLEAVYIPNTVNFDLKKPLRNVSEDDK